MTAPAKAAPMREDVTQAEKAFGRKIEGFGASYWRDTDQWRIYAMPDSSILVGTVEGYDKFRLDWIMAALREKQASEIARPDAGDEDVERVEVIDGATPVRDRAHALELLDDVDSLVRFCSVSMSDVERYNRGSIAFWRVVHWVAAMREGVDRGMVERAKEIEEAAREYFDHYLQDEADSEADCVWGAKQHLAAVRLRDALEQPR